MKLTKWAINPQDALAWNDNGIVLYEQGKFDEVLQCIDKGIEINPQDAKAWTGKGIVLETLGRTTDAAIAKSKELGYSR